MSYSWPCRACGHYSPKYFAKCEKCGAARRSAPRANCHSGCPDGAEVRECVCGREFEVRDSAPPWAVCVDCMKAAQSFPRREARS